MRSRYPRLVEAPDVAPLPGARLQVLDERAPGWRIVSWGSWSRCTAQQLSLAQQASRGGHHERQEQDRPHAALAPAEAGTVEGEFGWRSRTAEIAALDRIGYKPEKQDDAAAIGDALTAFISDSLLEFVTS